MPNKCIVQHLAVVSGELLPRSLTQSTLGSSSFEAIAAVGAQSTLLLVSTCARSSSNPPRHWCFDRRGGDEGWTGPLSFGGVPGVARLRRCTLSPMLNKNQRNLFVILLRIDEATSYRESAEACRCTTSPSGNDEQHKQRAGDSQIYARALVRWGEN